MLNFCISVAEFYTYLDSYAIVFHIFVDLIWLYVAWSYTFLDYYSTIHIRGVYINICICVLHISGQLFYCTYSWIISTYISHSYTHFWTAILLHIFVDFIQISVDHFYTFLDNSSTVLYIFVNLSTYLQQRTTPFYTTFQLHTYIRESYLKIWLVVLHISGLLLYCPHSWTYLLIYL